MSSSLVSRAQTLGKVAGRVLIVDDCEANRRTVEAVLEETGCVVVEARSGVEAVAKLREETFAVALLDVQMPGMDGYEVARRVRGERKTRDVAIIFVTAMSDTEEVALRGYGTGAVDVLFKPLDASILCAKVRVFLELAETRRALAEANIVLAKRNEELQALAKASAALTEKLLLASDELLYKNSELRKTQAQLIQSAKVASLGRLVAGVAHEINNPLGFASSHLRTIRKTLSSLRLRSVGLPSEEGERAWDRVHERLQGVSFGLERIRDLVVKLQAFSRFDEGERQRTRISDCMESVVTMVQHELGERIGIHVRCGAPDDIECYPDLLNQALLNLVSNAIDAIPETGDVTVTAGEEGGAYVIRVLDSGVGIREADREHVFDPFFTTKGGGGGAGLGLSVTSSIVKKHGGTLELLAAPTGGTEAVVKIPLHSQSEVRRASGS